MLYYFLTIISFLVLSKNKFNSKLGQKRPPVGLEPDRLQSSPYELLEAQKMITCPNLAGKRPKTRLLE